MIRGLCIFLLVVIKFFSCEFPAGFSFLVTRSEDSSPASVFTSGFESVVQIYQPDKTHWKEYCNVQKTQCLPANPLHLSDFSAFFVHSEKSFRIVSSVSVPPFVVQTGFVPVSVFGNITPDQLISDKNPQRVFSVFTLFDSRWYLWYPNTLSIADSVYRPLIQSGSVLPLITLTSGQGAWIGYLPENFWSVDQLRFFAGKKAKFDSVISAGKCPGSDSLRKIGPPILDSSLWSGWVPAISHHLSLCTSDQVYPYAVPVTKDIEVLNVTPLSSFVSLQLSKKPQKSQTHCVLDLATQLLSKDGLPVSVQEIQNLFEDPSFEQRPYSQPEISASAKIHQILNLALESQSGMDKNLQKIIPLFDSLSAFTAGISAVRNSFYQNWDSNQTLTSLIQQAGYVKPVFTTAGIYVLNQLSLGGIPLAMTTPVTGKMRFSSSQLRYDSYPQTLDIPLSVFGNSFFTSTNLEISLQANSVSQRPYAVVTLPVNISVLSDFSVKITIPQSSWIDGTLVKLNMAKTVVHVQNKAADHDDTQTGTPDLLQVPIRKWVEKAGTSSEFFNTSLKLSIQFMDLNFCAGIDCQKNFRIFEIPDLVISQ